jgi:predicted transcriptional regulator
LYGKELCLNARIVRLNLGYTKQELASECEVPLSVICAMEEGFVPSISIINRAFSFLGFDLLADLVGTSL